jgi:hypothetical protein
LGVELAGPIRAQLVKKRVMLVIAHHRLDDAAIEEHQKVPATRHGVPFAPELDHHCGLHAPVTHGAVVLMTQGCHLSIPVKQDPVAKKRVQDAGEQGRKALADVKQQAGEGKGLCFAENARDPMIDILAAIDLLVEPSFQGHEGTMDHRAVGKRPVVVPPKHVRIAEPRPGAIACDDGQTIVAGILPGGEIDQPEDKRKPLFGSLPQEQQEWAAAK